MSKLALLFVISALFVTAQENKSKEPKKEEPKVLSDKTKIIVKDAQIQQLNLQIRLLQAMMNLKEYKDLSAAENTLSSAIGMARHECGGQVDDNLNCVAPPPIPKPEKK
jgi:hypothetical protein